MPDYGSIGSGALTGAGTGAAIGSVIPGVGTGIGAAGGALIGGIAGYFRGRGNEGVQASMADARRRLDQLKREQYARRMQDLQRALSYFQGPQDILAGRNQPIGGPNPNQMMGGIGGQMGQGGGMGRFGVPQR